MLCGKIKILWLQADDTPIRLVLGHAWLMQMRDVQAAGVINHNRTVWHFMETPWLDCGEARQK